MPYPDVASPLRVSEHIDVGLSTNDGSSNHIQNVASVNRWLGGDRFLTSANSIINHTKNNALLKIKSIKKIPIKSRNIA